MSGCVFGTGPAAEVGAGAVKEAEDGVGVVIAIGEVFEFASEDERDAEFDAEAEPVNIAEIEAGVEDGDKAGAEVEVVPEPKSFAELGLVVFGCETYHNLSSEVVAWNSGVSLGFVFEPRVGFVFASEAEYMMAPCENIQGTLTEVLIGAQFGATAVGPELLDKPETVELDLFAEGMVGELDASAGQLLGFVTLVWVSTAGMETDPGSNPEGNMEVEL